MTFFLLIADPRDCSTENELVYPGKIVDDFTRASPLLSFRECKGHGQNM